MFLKPPLTARAAMRIVELRDGVERTRSTLSKVASTPASQLMTIRSWTTTAKLLALLDDPAPRWSARRVGATL